VSVQQTELIWRKSATGSSDGGAVSGTLLTSGLKNDLWPNISDASRLAGGARAKKVFVCNDAATDALVLPVIWIFQQPTNIAQQIGLGFDDTNDADGAQGNMTAFSASALAAFTSSAADVRTGTLWGLDAGGVPQTETITLNGTTEVLSVGTYSVVEGFHLASTNSNTVLVKEGTGGTTRGTIGSGKSACWLWFDANSKATGILLPSLPALSNYGVWAKQTWIAAAGGIRPDADILAIEES
jgi:hypothetical protein